MGYQPKVYREQGGNKLVVSATGVVDYKTGAVLQINGTQASALTAQLTTITHTAPGTPDYAIQDLVQNTGWGFATQDEGNTVLSVVRNLQARLAEVETILEAMGVAAN